MKKYLEPELNIDKLAFEANITASVVEGPEGETNGSTGTELPIVRG